MQRIILLLFFINVFVIKGSALNKDERAKRNADSATVYYQRYISTDSLLLKIYFLKKAQKFEVRDSVWQLLGDLFNGYLGDRYGSIHYYKKGLPKNKKDEYSSYETFSHMHYSNMLNLIGKRKKALQILNKYEKDTAELNKERRNIAYDVLYFQKELKELGDEKNYKREDYVKAVLCCLVIGNRIKMNHLINKAFKKYPNDGCLYYRLSGYIVKQGKYKLYNKYYRTALKLGCNDDIKYYFPFNEKLLKLYNLY